MPNVASQRAWTINSASQGNRKLRGLSGYTADDDAETTTVNEVGSADPQGFRRKPGGWTVEFDLNELTGALEVDWDKLRDSQELFSLTSQLVGGRRHQYLDCTVSKYTTDGDDEGKHSAKVSIVCLRRKVL